MAETYFKLVVDLNRTELVKIYDSLDGRVFPTPIPISDKASVAANILHLDDSILARGKKYFFKKDKEAFIEYLPTFATDHPNVADSVEQKFAKRHHRLDLDRIKTSKAAKDINSLMANLPITDSDIEDELDLSDDESVNEADATTPFYEPFTSPGNVDDRQTGTPADADGSIAQSPLTYVSDDPVTADIPTNPQVDLSEINASDLLDFTPSQTTDFYPSIDDLLS
ncbi:Oidioi.mRNA.OKI2018_I69.PAR.g13020.t1.cds [Oikopleura dioica]|uniref:Oidioi.mRNA.OKI2018_I69.PAR.g13020.t1.cds n=1 Tax=Oikopleura dioica TaxID=34765 RepID=A0ABN7S799_OIKDI|nr:Oidioi.mRNA.OKI2018_I69.PAR.g13020.t1.cds [Oikopleura dioica]